LELKSINPIGCLVGVDALGFANQELKK